MSDYWDRYLRRRASRRTFVAGSGVAIAGTAAVLAGCGDDDDDDTTSTATSATGTTTSGASATGTAAQDDPKRYGGTFRTSSLDPYRGLDPAINTLVPTFHNTKAYSRTHIFQVSTQKVILDMATAVEQPDPTTVRFTLRPDIKFQNVAPMNGRALTSADVAFSIGRFADVGKLGSTLNASAWSFLDLTTIKTPDEKTFTINLKAPAADVIVAMGQHFYGVVAKEVVEANGGNLTKVNAAGAGPYVLTQGDITTKMVYTRNKDYFSHDHSDPVWFPKGGAYFEKFELNIIKDPTTTQAQLISGDLDGLYQNSLNVDSALAADFKSKGLTVLEGKANEHVGLGLSNSRLPDKRMRQAIQKAIDYDGFIQRVYLGNGQIGAPVAGDFPATVRLPEADIRKYLKFDAKAAKDLWTAAGGPDKLVGLGIAGLPFMEQALAYIKSSLENSLGITVEIVNTDIPSWIARVVNPVKDYDLYVFFDQSLPDMPSTNALSGYNPAGTTPNTTNFAVDSPIAELAQIAKDRLALYQKQDQALTPAARQPAIYEFQTHALDTATPSIPLPVKKIQYMVATKRVKNMDLMVNDVSFWTNHATNNLYLDPTTP